MSDDRSPADHVVDGEDSEDAEARRKQLEENLKSRSTWLRLLFMVVFYVLASVASLVASVVIVLGFFWVLFTGEINGQLQRAGQSIATYLYQIVRYLTYNSDERPFPFDAEWPSADDD